MLKTLVESFAVPDYGRTTRTDDAYTTADKIFIPMAEKLKVEYNAESSKPNPDLMAQRFTRDYLDYTIRRYHGYCIEGRFGSHYVEDGVGKAFTDFEHLVPAARIRDMFLADVLTIKQALNAPTVFLSRIKHKALHTKGLGSNTPNIWLPFQRYSQHFPNTVFKTNDGKVIDPDSWTLQNHFDYFKI